MSSLFFYVFSTLALACGLGVVFNKNTVTSALCLLGVLVSLAGIFVLLEAFLLAVLLIFVYAGAVVALFLFIVMLTDAAGGGGGKRFSKTTLVAGLISAVLLLAALYSIYAHGSFDTIAPAASVGASLKTYGRELFTTYLLPVQIVGFLLLIAMLGVIVISKKNAGESVTGTASEANK
ncbi:NADH-quinone oxidoreductase subunit J family protein [Geminisphaera colitermitum]|uniref:NADH-quinone oxidoreductase subunit J family protein n=1 Tax=Geminisphaera colitermitum TaxID=1148786 RepID=UPI00019653AF|nr:NADH-quinone oxidoreductase subunit J [Geminisphaera colitermitum]